MGDFHEKTIYLKKYNIKKTKKQTNKKNFQKHCLAEKKNSFRAFKLQLISKKIKDDRKSTQMSFFSLSAVYTATCDP